MAALRTPDGRLYLSRPALAELDHAQAELDTHIGTDTSGRCLACREEIPCRTRERASLTFRRSGALPRRTPGLARVRPAGSSARTATLSGFKPVEP